MNGDFDFDRYEAYREEIRRLEEIAEDLYDQKGITSGDTDLIIAEIEENNEYCNNSLLISNELAVVLLEKKLENIEKEDEDSRSIKYWISKVEELEGDNDSHAAFAEEEVRKSRKSKTRRRSSNKQI